MSEVWRTDLPTVEKMVLLVIADHANDEGTQAYPAQVTIARKASISVRTVQRAVNSLVARGYIRLSKHSGGSADCRDDRRPHLYQINLNVLRGDNLTGRTDVADGATLTTPTGRQSRPMNHPLEPSKKHPDQFDIFWNTYPRKVAKAAALKAWEKAVKCESPEVIIEGARRYADDPNREDRFTAHPTTWLNAHRWGDEPLPERELSKEEMQERERKKSREREIREREDTKEFFRQLAEQREKAVPMPDALKQLFKKL